MKLFIHFVILFSGLLNAVPGAGGFFKELGRTHQPGPPQKGEYSVAWRDVRVRTLDRSCRHLVLVFPRRLLRRDRDEKFPLLVFLHGFLGGGLSTYWGHTALLRGIASFGFIVAAPRSCSFGCPSYRKWSTYYKEGIKVIDWVQKHGDGCHVLEHVNRTAGYGIMGHSTGAQAAVEVLNTDGYNFRAGVLLHSESVSTIDVTVPVALFTGTNDECCGEDTMKPMYDQINGVSKAYAAIVGGKHTEPNLFQSRWPAYIAAWFRIFLSGEQHGSSSFNLIYGIQSDSLCGGSIPMTGKCEAILKL